MKKIVTYVFWCKCLSLDHVYLRVGKTRQF
jgi:hypothetical protein